MIISSTPGPFHPSFTFEDSAGNSYRITEDEPGVIRLTLREAGDARTHGSALTITPQAANTIQLAPQVRA